MRTSSTTKPIDGSLERWRAIGIVCLVIGLLALLVAAPVIGYGVHLGNKVRAAQERLADKGVPTTIEAWSALYEPVPEDTNAAPTYLRAVEAFSRSTESQVDFGELSGYLPDRRCLDGYHLEAAALRLLRANEETLRLLEQATAFPDCRFPLDFTKGYDMDLPFLESLGGCARLLALSALQAVDTHDNARFLNAVYSLACLGEAMAEIPTIYTQLYCM